MCPASCPAGVTLTQIALVLSRLRRAFVLQEVRERLGLAPDRLQLLSTLATTAAPGDAALRAVAALLGMPDAAQAAVQTLCQGVYPLMVHLILSLCVAMRCHSSDLIRPPVVVWTPWPCVTSSGKRYPVKTLLPAPMLVPVGRPRLAVPSCQMSGQPWCSPKQYYATYSLPSPQQTFAGLLLTNGLLVLSPYRISGRSKTSEHVLWAEPPATRTSPPRRSTVC